MELLLIDDKPKQAAWMCLRLKNKRNQVTVIPDLQMGQALFRQFHYDAVLFIVRLDEIDESGETNGWDAKDLPHPLLLVVSPDTAENRVWGLENGADDCVGNNVDSRELTARLFALHKRKTRQFIIVSTLQLADLAVDLFNKTVHRGEKRIDLLAREYELLVFLMKNKNCVVSKKEIISNNWPTSQSVRPGTIEVYINCLRKKIDHGASVKLIHTVLGLGYIMRVPEKDFSR